jgi:hypothetical protein
LLDVPFVEPVPADAIALAQGYAIDAEAAAVAAVEAAQSTPLYVPTFADLADLVPGDVALGGYVMVLERGGEKYQRVATGGDLNFTGSGGVRLTRIYPSSLDFKLVRPPVAPALALGTAGALTGIYYYRITYVTADGKETGPGTISGAITPAAQRINVTVPVSSDPRVVARRIYRTPANPGSSTWLLKRVVEIADNTTTAYVDNAADGALGVGLWFTDQTSAVIRDTNVEIGGEVIGAIGPLATTLGHNALPNGGYATTAIGANAMSSNVSGARAVAVGHDALKANTTGYNITAVGVHALTSNTTGIGNNAFGYAALFNATTGNYNSAFGGSALESMVTGSYNAAFGPAALQLRASGDDNVGIGQSAGRTSAGSGNGNIHIGRGTGSTITTANFSAVVGYLAAPGGGNLTTALGAYAGQRLTTGGNNLFLGPNAGSWFTTEGNSFMLDGFARADLADSQVKAMMYGVFGATVATQTLHLNARAHLNGGISLPAVAVTADYTVLSTDYRVVVTPTATLTLTLPSAVTFAGKVLKILNRGAFAINSASSNIVPLAGGALTTAILPATAGKWVELHAISNQWSIVEGN